MSGRPVPDLVLVGSSVAWRLKEEYFSRPRVRNLALAGGSPVTSLDIVAKQKSLPKIVLIETNVLTRLADDALIAKFSGGARTEALFLRPVRTAVAAYETWNHTPPSAADARAERDRLLSEPPSPFDNKVYLDRAVQQMNDDDPTVPARVNVARMKELIDDIERRGSRAFLLEIPFAPEIEESRMVTMSKAIVHAAFPDRARWLPINPPLERTALGRRRASRREIGPARRARDRKRHKKRHGRARRNGGPVAATLKPWSRRRR